MPLALNLAAVVGSGQSNLRSQGLASVRGEGLLRRSWRTARRPNAGRRALCLTARMHLPTDAFGGKSAEKKASEMLITLCTFCAVRIILAQEEGYDNEGGTRSEVYKELTRFLDEEPMRNGTEWVSKLMKHPRTELRLMAVRIVEVREVYIRSQFNFEKLQDQALDGIKQENEAVLKTYLEDSLAVDTNKVEE
ncbi:hypothetical protein BSKO_08352 [Bryopsis sp. KO-2023]|nr:hypothetical protein BSKO_08352 [Bryopsis sp. KO-2023]